MSFQVLWQREFPHGICVAVELPEHPSEISPEVLHQLATEERSFAESCTPRRRLSWVGGRLALHTCMQSLGGSPGAVLATPRGAPLMPAGFVGSVSHKDAIAIALVSPDTGWALGVDLEHARPPRTEIERLVLTPEERSENAKLDGADRWRDLLLRFSLKESVYKALDPWVQRFVKFAEVRVSPLPGGKVEIHYQLDKGEGPFDMELSWQSQDDCFITSAKIRPRKAEA